MLGTVTRLLLFLVGFTLPLQAFSLVDVGFRMTPFKLATALLLLVGVLHMLAGARRPRDRTVVWVGVFALGFGVSVVQGIFRGVPLDPLIRVTVSFYSLILYYLLVGYVVRDRASLMTLLWGVMAGGATTALPAVLGLQDASALGRYSGLSGQENLFGIDMTVVIAIGTGLFVGTRSTVRKGLLAGVITAALFGLFLSLSRTAYMASFGMWCLWLYRSGRMDTIRYAVPAALLLVAALLLAPDTVGERIGTVFDPSRRARDGAIQGRLKGLELGTRAFATNPLLGIGQLNYIPWAQSQPDGRTIGHVIHNAYLAIATEQGLLALVPYLMILVLSWRQYTLAWNLGRSRRRMKDPWLMELTGYALFLQIALFSTIIAGLTAHAQRSKTAWLMIALAPVIYNLVVQRIEEIASEPAPSDEPVFDALPGSRLPA